VSEPLSFDADVVAAFLERQQRPQMAQFVRNLNGRAKESYMREQHLKDKVDALAKRLHKYEPPAGRQPDVVWTGD